MEEEEERNKECYQNHTGYGAAGRDAANKLAQERECPQNANVSTEAQYAGALRGECLPGGQP